MFNIKKTILFLLTITLISCGSDNLSNSKAEKIISKCLDKEPIQKSISLKINQVSFRSDSKKLEKYKKIEKDGLIKMTFIDIKTKKAKLKKADSNDPLSKWRYEAEIRRIERMGNTYNIEITNKAKKYIEKTSKNGNSIYMKSFSCKVDKILEVQEIPSMNVAKVKVQFKVIDITPFAILSRNRKKTWSKTLKFTKTSNGWKYCDNF